MNMRIRRGMRHLVMIFAIIVVFTVGFYAFTFQSVSHEPMDFYATSREVSLGELVDFADKYDISLYLPSELPNNLKLTAIYLKDGPFVAILVYSAEGNKDYKTAELTIEIIPTSDTPTLNELESRAESSPFEYLPRFFG